MRRPSWKLIADLKDLLRPLPANPAEQVRRIRLVERTVVLPAKLCFIGVLIWFFYFTTWLGDASSIGSGVRPGRPVAGWTNLLGVTRPLGTNRVPAEASGVRGVITNREGLPGHLLATNPASAPDQLGTNRVAGEPAPVRSGRSNRARERAQDIIERIVLEQVSFRDVAEGVVRRFFIIYLAVNAVVALLLWQPIRRSSLRLVHWAVFVGSVVDALFLAGLAVLTGGFSSLLYWLFLALIIRNAVVHPLAAPQLALNFCTVGSFVVGGLIDLFITTEDQALLGEARRIAAEIAPLENPADPFLLRLALLLLMTACCYFLQVLFEKQRVAIEEAQEAATRKEQLKTAGRLAGEIAHQLKNPLGIINNAAWSLQRAVGEGRPPSPQHLGIIRDEIQRADRILTELMGHAQLTEGTIDRLNLVEEVNHAIAEVLPPGVFAGYLVHTDFAPQLPPLMMQRRHLREILVNLLKNAREAMPNGGQITVSVRPLDEFRVEVVVEDSGPGITPDRLERIFEPYVTTKPSGTGLGLAIVRQNADIYGATVRAESQVGHGARFVLEFPTRTVLKLRG